MTIRATIGMFALSLAVSSTGHAGGPAARSTIDGAWETGCLPIGKNGRHGFVTRLEIKRGRIAASSQIYAHSTCDTPTVRTDYHGKIVGERSTGEGIIDFDHEVEAITTTADDPEVVTIYNAGNPGSGCGLGGGWQLGVARPVDGALAHPGPFPRPARVSTSALGSRATSYASAVSRACGPIFRPTSVRRRPACWFFGA